MRFFICLFVLFFSFNLYASEFFNPEKYSSHILSLNEALNYHFSSANILKYNISSYDEYEKLLSSNSTLNLSLDYTTLDFSIGDYNYKVLLLVGTSNDTMMRPDGSGAGYITIWLQQNDKFKLIASNEIYSIYGVSLSFDEENQVIEIDSPMGQCETVFFRTTLSIKNHQVYYNTVDISFLTTENTMKTNIIYSNKKDKPILLNNKNGLTFNY